MWNDELWTNVLLLATVIAVASTAIVQAVKNMVNLPKNILPLISVIVGVVVAIAASPFTDADLTLRLWAGVLAGLSGTGFFELVTKRDGTTKKD